MIVNFSCLKLGVGKKLFMLDLGQNDFILCKKKKVKNNNGKKGLHNEILQDSDIGCKFPSDYLQITLNFPLFSVSPKERMK